MTFARALFFALAVGSAATACNDSQFSGASSTATKEKPKAEPAAADAKKPTDDKASRPQDKKPKADGPSAVVDTGLGKGSKNNGGTGSMPVPPTPTPGTDLGGTGNGGKSITDLLGGILGGGPAVDNGNLGKQPDDNNVVFGDDKTFHVGDGQATQSSCLSQIASFPVSAKQYLFEFDVLADGQVAVDIGYICGVDYSDTNLVYIAQNGQPKTQPLPLPVGGTSFSIPPTPLAQGHYQIGIESRTGTTDPDGNPADADDYVIGKVHIQSKGAKIKIGKVLVN